MTFANPENLWFLLVLPLALLLALHECISHQYLIKKLGSHHAQGDSGRVFIIRWLSLTVLFLLALGSLVVALASPRWGEEYVEEDIEGMETVIVLDVSQSMLVADQEPSRLARAKEIILGMLSDLPEGNHGLVTVKGAAELTVPLTFDHLALERELGRAGPERGLGVGTRLDLGLMEAVKAFPEGSRAYKTIVLVSDGGDGAQETLLLDAARYVADRGIYLVVVGVGTLEGGQLLTNEGESINVVLNAQTLKAVADLARGQYIDSDDAALYNRLAITLTEKAQEMNNRGFRIQSRDQSWIFIALALLSLAGLSVLKGLRWRVS